MTFGEWIQARRSSLRLTQADLAEAIGVSTQGVQRWEQDLGIPASDVLWSLAATIQVEPVDLLWALAEKRRRKAEVESRRGELQVVDGGEEQEVQEVQEVQEPPDPPDEPEAS